jgi:hypothetical protein
LVNLDYRVAETRLPRRRTTPWFAVALRSKASYALASVYDTLPRSRSVP